MSSSRYSPVLGFTSPASLRTFTLISAFYAILLEDQDCLEGSERHSAPETE